ncbi:UPF0104 family protein [Ectothiorhodospiraceae bacterium BW-2]|nr:UPF0104 family protein [Ectothiorhodospiraceae bacterium BW-2]
MIKKNIFVTLFRGGRSLVLPIVGLLLLGLLIWYYGFTNIINTIFSEFELNWAIISALCILISTLIGSVNVYLFLARINSLSLNYAKFLRFYWLSWGVGQVVPGQVGDIATLGITLRKHGISASTTIGRAAMDKVISLLVITLVGLIGIFLLINQSNGMIDMTPSWFWLSSILLVAAIFWFLNPRILQFFDVCRDDWRGDVGRARKEFIHIFRHEFKLIQLNLFFTVNKVGLIGLAYWAMFRALGESELTILQTIPYATLSGLIAYLPISFNGLGTVEAAAIILFDQLGVSADVVLSVYLCLRIMILILAWLPSLLLIFFESLTPILNSGN